MSNELKPCPFCGEEELLQLNDSEHPMNTTAHGESSVFCMKCKSSSRHEYLARAIHVWNTRPADSVVVPSDYEQGVADVLCYILDNGEQIPEEQLQVIGSKVIEAKAVPDDHILKDGDQCPACGFVLKGAGQ